MRSATFLLMLLVAPAALADVHFRPSARLLHTPTTHLLAGSSELSLEGLSRAQLEAERTRILDERPSLVKPIVLLAVGAPLAIGGFFSGLTLWVALGSASSAGTAALIFTAAVATLFTVAAGVGIALVIVGAVTLPSRIGARRRADTEVQRVEEALGKLPPDAPAAPAETPPPAAPPDAPTPQTLWGAPSPALCLATF